MLFRFESTPINYVDFELLRNDGVVHNVSRIAEYSSAIVVMRS